MCRHHTGAFLELGAFFNWIIHKSALSGSRNKQTKNIPLKMVSYKDGIENGEKAAKCLKKSWKNSRKPGELFLKNTKKHKYNKICVFLIKIQGN